MAPRFGLTPAALTVQVETGGLAAGTYHAEIKVSPVRGSLGALSVPVTLDVRETRGPRVTSAVANGNLAISAVRVTFSEAINPSSFTVDDVANFSGPNGPVPVVGVVVVAATGSTQFDITFNTQTTAGSYSFELGPAITDLAGNLMDQNDNGIEGEAGDAYQAGFTLFN